MIRPAIVGDLTHAGGTYTTPEGRAAVSWTRTTDGRVALHVTVPANTTAEIWVPTSGGSVAAPPSATYTRSADAGGRPYAVHQVGPGTFSFHDRA